MDTNLPSFSKLTNMKGLKIIHLNCYSIINKIDEIRQVLIMESNVDILCITESWLKPYHDSNLFAIPSYTLYRLDRIRTSRTGAYIHGGGIACYVKSYITSCSLDYSHASIDLEQLVISVKLEEQRLYYVCIVYRPPSGNYAVALNKMMDLINNLRMTNKRHSIIIGGDLNIDLSQPKSTPSVRALNKFCRELSLSCFINTPTRHSIKNSSIIDLFLGDCNIISSHGVINYNISDHLAIYITIKKTKEIYSSSSFRGRSYLNYNKDLFQEKLFYTNWGKFYAMNDVNLAWEFFFNVILRESDLMCPCREFRIRRDRPPWFSFEIIELCANRDHLYSVGHITKNNYLINEARKL